MSGPVCRTVSLHYMRFWAMTDRRALLSRLERLRAVERQEALARLAQARAEQRRMEEVAARSRMLAGDSSATVGVQDGAALASTLMFQARLAGLVNDADHMGARASAVEALALARFANADRRLERVRERRHQADCAAETQQMARSLLNSSQKPRRLF